MMKILFMGTPDFAAAHLSALLAAGCTVVGVVTQPDRPVGRGGKVAFSPVKKLALSHGLPVYQPRRLRRPEIIAELKALAPDISVVVAYGQILSKEALAIGRLGSVNVHGSLLPRWRGADPIRRAVMEGDTETGVTTMWMDEGMDTGDMILKAATTIGPEETAGDVHDRLMALGANLIVETLRQIEAGTAPRTPQPAGGATYAPKLEPADEVIDWQRSTAAVVNQVRGLNPFPGAYSVGPTGRLKVWKAVPWGGTEGAGPGEGRAAATGAGSATGAGRPGEVTEVVRNKGFAVATGDGAVLLLEVQPENSRRMDAWSFVAGRQVAPGWRFEV